ncbi:MAG: hypothetical protein HY927_12400 [Elusimicrobia bacterium]|nr:hypothetical protein [Elusimicrobiota bacterium]
MAKKPKRANVPQSSAEQPGSTEGITGPGKTAIGIGIGILVLGFFVLSFADPMGRNWAAHLSPFLILGGYALVGAGIFLPESNPSAAVPHAGVPGPGQRSS